MRTTLAIIALALSVATAGVAEAGHSLLGLNIGTSLVSINDVTLGTTTVTGQGASLIPGLRVGYSDDASSFEVVVDVSGFFEPSRNGLPHQYDYSLMASADDAMISGETTSFFITGGIGFQRFDRDVWSATREVYGGGVGLRRSVSDDRGALRAELRFDHAPERSVDVAGVGPVVVPEANAVSLKLGFDLRFN